MNTAANTAAKSDISKRLTRDDWLSGALELCEQGIEQVKVAPLATRLGVTTGSFYWHFKNRQELLDGLLYFWEQEMTDRAISETRDYEGDPVERIYVLMDTVVKNNLARYDLPIWQWAQSDIKVKEVFDRVLQKRFAYSTEMFALAGFPSDEAKARGRLMATYLMAESTLIDDDKSHTKELLRMKHRVLTTRS